VGSGGAVMALSLSGDPQWRHRRLLPALRVLQVGQISRREAPRSCPQFEQVTAEAGCSLRHTGQANLIISLAQLGSVAPQQYAQRDCDGAQRGSDKHAAHDACDGHMEQPLSQIGEHG
jgi:hypothetical protein